MEKSRSDKSDVSTIQTGNVLRLRHPFQNLSSLSTEYCCSEYRLLTDTLQLLIKYSSNWYSTVVYQ